MSDGPLSGLGSRGLPFGAYFEPPKHLFLGWADLFARIGNLSTRTAVDRAGGIDWLFDLFQWKPADFLPKAVDETCM